MTTEEKLRSDLQETAMRVKKENPMAASITNTVTVNLVANAQLAVGGSAAMIYLPDEGEGMAHLAGAMYINMGTLLPVYEETLPRTVRALQAERKPWVLDPVGIGLGALRGKILRGFQAYRPGVIRGNASEIIALANLWGLASGRASDGVRGVDATDSVDAARAAAIALALETGGAVAVSGPVDLVTDGHQVIRVRGGSRFLPLITGAGCSLGGAIAVYAAVGKPFIAALAGTMAFDLAAARAEEGVVGPASFQVRFLDELYRISPEELAEYPFSQEEV
ncbi:MAG: hydroxyethylthiazole kinase [Negativicutes bacterium]